ncbi:MAG: IS30 family transposase [Spirochaetia bacterium]|nr:IS30 family transposase [Spirochaetia bacterium]
MGSKFSHLKLSDRNVINNMLKDGQKVTDISKALGVHQCTIYRELKRCKTKGSYSATYAQKNYEVHRKYCVYHKEWPSEIFKTIKELLIAGFSPDAIVGRSKLFIDLNINISHQTVYNWVIKGYLGKGVQKYLLFGKKGYTKSENSLKTLKNKDKKRIDTMPEGALKGNVVGHFQSDTMHGAKQSGAIATLADVNSRYILADKMADKTADSFSNSLKFVFSDIDNEKLKSILEDNGSEMANFKSDEEMLNCKIYFTYPGRPWEKALVENSNRLLRRFFPKKMKFNNVTREMVLQAITWINNMPRKSLGYRTAYEVFHNVKTVAFEI